MRLRYRKGSSLLGSCAACQVPGMQAIPLTMHGASSALCFGTS